MGLVFGRTGFTEPAKIMTRFINPLSILIWEFEELKYSIERQEMCHTLHLKYRYAVERGMPDCNVLKEVLE
jgi:hypothetical protein